MGMGKMRIAADTLWNSAAKTTLILTVFLTLTQTIILTRQIFRLGTVRYAEGLRRMHRHRPVIAHCIDSERLPNRYTAL